MHKGGRRRSLEIITIAFFFLVLGSLRFPMLGADFPAVSGSVSEYGDMGWCLRNVRNRLLEGKWGFEKTAVSLGSPLHSAAVYFSERLWGHSAEAVTAVSVAALVLMLGSAAVYWIGRYDFLTALLGICLLGTQQLLFAYSYSWKQEMLMMAFLGSAVLSCALDGRKGSVVPGILSGVGLFVKLSGIGFVMGILVAFATEPVSFRRRLRRIAFFFFGMCIVLGMGWCVARISLSREGFSNAIQWYGMVMSDRVAVQPTFGERLANICRSNVLIRSFPEALVGLGLMVPVVMRRRTSAVETAFAVSTTVYLLGGFLAGYYPLRWIVAAVPGLVFLAVAAVREGEYSRGVTPVMGGLVVGQAAGYCVARFLSPNKTGLILGVALGTFLVTFGLVEGLSRLKVGAALEGRMCASEANQEGRGKGIGRTVCAILLLSIGFHLVVDLSWIRGRHYDQRDIGYSIAKVTGEKAAVYPTSFIGWQTLYPTRMSILDEPREAEWVLWDSTKVSQNWKKREEGKIVFKGRLRIPEIILQLYHVPTRKERKE